MQMFDRGRKVALGMAVLAAATAGSAAVAQTPGLPTLQNAFTNPGIAVAANYGVGGGQSFFGAAGGWGFGGRFGVSGAAGIQRSNDASRGAYGARATVNAWTNRSGSLGLGAFVGIGGSPRTRDDDVTTNPAVVNIPVGASVGYQWPIGETRGISIYGSPMYRWTRTEADDVTTTIGAFAGGVGIDFAVTRSFGLTVGGEFASGSDDATTTAFGIAVSFVPGRGP